MPEDASLPTEPAKRSSPCRKAAPLTKQSARVRLLVLLTFLPEQGNPLLETKAGPLNGAAKER
eukprot:2887485-Pyramimonas_sp.AAC.1